MLRQEQLRRSYQPSPIDLLFIGESPPASGRFFYQRDSGLYRAMREVFQVADEDFLKAFQSAGCYLIDLCPEPVDHLDPNLRREICRANEPHLANAIKNLQPPKIATLLRSIEGNVKHAAQLAGWQGPIIHLPYPGRWSKHRKVFAEALEPIVKSLR
jgi:uracil DNA glycosylase superfamily protein